MLSYRKRIIILVVLLLGLGAFLVVSPLLLGCQGGMRDGLPIQCSAGDGFDTYSISGDEFTIGRLANWQRPLYVEANNVVTINVNGTLDLVNNEQPGHVQTNDMTLMRGDGVIRASGDYSSAYPYLAALSGSGTLVLDGGLQIPAQDLIGDVIRLTGITNRLLINDRVTLTAAGTRVTGLWVKGDLALRSLTPDGVKLLVQGQDSAIGATAASGTAEFVNALVRVEGPDAVGVQAERVTISGATQILVPDGTAVEMQGSGSLIAFLVASSARIAGGKAAVRGDDAAQNVILGASVEGDIDLGGGDDELSLYQSLSVTVASENINLGAGDDTVEQTWARVAAAIAEAETPKLRRHWRERFAETLSDIAEGRLTVSPIITGEVGLDGVAQAFEDLGNPDRHAKTLVRHG